VLINTRNSGIPVSTVIPYRSEIDGLRAIAVLAVVFFHAGVPSFSAGFIGVDIFFVISGFLITSIIHRDIENKRFSLIDFYERRARRILPPLFLMILVCLPFAWLWLLPNAYKDFSQSLVATVSYVSNILFYIETGYFDVTSAQKPLLHTWSLSVEEQFYVVFPLALLATLKLSRRLVMPAMIVSMLASMACAEWLQSVNPDAAFYLIFSRAWELLIGAVGAILVMNGRVRSLQKHAGWLSLVGLVSIFGSLAFFPAGASTPSLFVLPCVVGTALVLMFAQQPSIAGRLLGWRPLVNIGLISYSVYIWHQPLLAFLRIRMLDEPSMWMSVIVAMVSLPVGWVSWRFIEQPFRNRNVTSRRTIFASSIALSALIFAVGAAGQLRQGFPERLSDEARTIAGVFNEEVAMFEPCLSTEQRYLSPDDTCRRNPDMHETVMLYGDSHAAAMAPEVAKVFAAKGAGLRQFTHSGCMPVLGIQSSVPGESCERFNIDAMDYLDTHPAIDTVVLASRWTSLLEGTLFDNQEGGNEGDIVRYMEPVAAQISTPSPDARMRSVASLVQRQIHSLLERGKKVIIIYQIPEAGWDVPAYLAKEIVFGGKRSVDLSTSVEVYKARNAVSNAMLDSIGNNVNLMRVKPAELFCDALQQGRCLLQMQGHPLYIDDDHLSQLGASIVAARLR
jgi:peptidoglycan/LPS O-acetylase OafA/YrhL